MVSKRIGLAVPLAFVLAAATLGSCGIIAGCQPVVPGELPSGAAPGTLTEGVSGGAKQAVWGSGDDLVDEAIGIWKFGDGDVLLADVKVRGAPGHVYEAGIDGQEGLGLVWTENGCDYTVTVAPSVTAEELVEYAGRF